MKAVNLLYYLCIGVASCFAIFFFWSAEPKGLLFAIPISVFLLKFPKIKLKLIKQKLNLNGPYDEVCDKLIQIKDELDMREAKISDVEDIIDEAKEECQEKVNYCESRQKDSEKLLKALVPTMSGEVYERYVGYKIRGLNYNLLNYTPSSGDFGADIIAIDPDGKKVCIQCKRYEYPVGIDAIQQISSARQYYDCEIAIVATNSKFTPSAKELAQKVGVVLWEKFI